MLCLTGSRWRTWNWGAVWFPHLEVQLPSLVWGDVLGSSPMDFRREASTMLSPLRVIRGAMHFRSSCADSQRMPVGIPNSLVQRLAVPWLWPGSFPTSWPQNPFGLRASVWTRKSMGLESAEHRWGIPLPQSLMIGQSAAWMPLHLPLGICWRAPESLRPSLYEVGAQWTPSHWLLAPSTSGGGWSFPFLHGSTYEGGWWDLLPLALQLESRMGFTSRMARVGL